MHARLRFLAQYAQSHPLARASRSVSQSSENHAFCTRLGQQVVLGVYSKVEGLSFIGFADRLHLRGLSPRRPSATLFVGGVLLF